MYIKFNINCIYVLCKMYLNAIKIWPIVQAKRWPPGFVYKRLINFYKIFLISVRKTCFCFVLNGCLHTLCVLYYTLFKYIICVHLKFHYCAIFCLFRRHLIFPLFCNITLLVPWPSTFATLSKFFSSRLKFACKLQKKFKKLQHYISSAEWLDIQKFLVGFAKICWLGKVF